MTHNATPTVEQTKLTVGQSISGRVVSMHYATVTKRTNSLKIVTPSGEEFILRGNVALLKQVEDTLRAFPGANPTLKITVVGEEPQSNGSKTRLWDVRVVLPTSPVASTSPAAQPLDGRKAIRATCPPLTPKA